MIILWKIALIITKCNQIDSRLLLNFEDVEKKCELTRKNILFYYNTHIFHVNK